jgi:hypothetical protein
MTHASPPRQGGEACVIIKDIWYWRVGRRNIWSSHRTVIEYNSESSA